MFYSVLWAPVLPRQEDIGTGPPRGRKAVRECPSLKWRALGHSQTGGTKILPSHEQRKIRSQRNGSPETNPRAECPSPHPGLKAPPPLTSFRVMILGCCPYRRRISISSEGSRLLLSMT